MKPRLLTIAKLSLLLGVAVPASSAQAQFAPGPTPCASGSALTQFNPDAIACSGSWIGNNAAGPSVAGTLSVITSDFLSYVGAGSWTYQGTTDAGTTSGPFSYVPAFYSGVLIFDSPLSGLFAIALKSSTHFSIYLFNGGSGLAQIDFTTIGTSLNQRGIAQDLSHASLYTFAGAGQNPPPVTSTPEPATLLLTASGIASLGGYVRRRRSRLNTH